MCKGEAVLGKQPLLRSPDKLAVIASLITSTPDGAPLPDSAYRNRVGNCTAALYTADFAFFIL